MKTELDSLVISDIQKTLMQIEVHCRAHYPRWLNLKEIIIMNTGKDVELKDPHTGLEGVKSGIISLQNSLALLLKLIRHILYYSGTPHGHHDSCSTMVQAAVFAIAPYWN